MKQTANRRANLLAVSFILVYSLVYSSRPKDRGYKSLKIFAWLSPEFTAL
jgi:hypothetical protein